jgi:hypothetical protein
MNDTIIEGNKSRIFDAFFKCFNSFSSLSLLDPCKDKCLNGATCHEGSQSWICISPPQSLDLAGAKIRLSHLLFSLPMPVPLFAKNGSKILFCPFYIGGISPSIYFGGQILSLEIPTKLLKEKNATNFFPV